MTTDLVVAGDVKEGKKEKEQGLKLGPDRGGVVGGVPLQA